MASDAVPFHTIESIAGPGKTNRHGARYVSYKRVSVRNRTHCADFRVIGGNPAPLAARESCLNNESSTSRANFYKDSVQTCRRMRCECMRANTSIARVTKPSPMRSPLPDAARVRPNNIGGAAITVTDATQLNQFENAAAVLREADRTPYRRSK
jgi:hypothetical protein